MLYINPVGEYILHKAVADKTVSAIGILPVTIDIKVGKRCGNGVCFDIHMARIGNLAGECSLLLCAYRDCGISGFRQDRRSAVAVHCCRRYLQRVYAAVLLRIRQ